MTDINSVMARLGQIPANVNIVDDMEDVLDNADKMMKVRRSSAIGWATLGIGLFAVCMKQMSDNWALASYHATVSTIANEYLHSYFPGD